MERGELLGESGTSDEAAADDELTTNSTSMVMKISTVYFKIFNCLLSRLLELLVTPASPAL